MDLAEKVSVDRSLLRGKRGVLELILPILSQMRGPLIQCQCEFPCGVPNFYILYDTYLDNSQSPNEVARKHKGPLS
jgi:hypothetical protein